MKLQSLGIIFVIIFLPMVIVLSYFIQLQVDTITLQTSYDTKLLNATYGAVSSFELNTANEDLSNVADSLRSIIEASNSIFFNTLATNFGMSNSNKSSIRSYVPGVLYTLYDGYYIYSPTEQPLIRKYGYTYHVDGNKVIEKAMTDDDYNTFMVGVDADERATKISAIKAKVGQPIKCSESDREVYGKDADQVIEDGILRYVKKNGNSVSFVTDINEKDIQYIRDYMIKSYMPYSAHYVSGNIDVVINYTLDNYMNIVGNIGDVYYTKTGYLISEDEMVDKVWVDDNTKLLELNEDSAEEYILSGEHSIEIELTDKETNRKVRLSTEKTRYQFRTNES